MGLLIGLKKLYKDKKSTLFNACVLSLGIIIPVLFMSVAISFLTQGVAELEGISFMLRFYTANETNAFNKFVIAFAVISLILGTIVVLISILNITLKTKKSFKNYLLMGASFGQLMTISWLTNVVLLMLSVIIGGVCSYLFGFIVCKIFNVAFIFMIDYFLIALLINFALVSIVSIVMPLWTSTSRLKTNK